MFAWFENRINPYEQEKVEQPPSRLLAFYWYYIRQVWPWFLLVMFIGVFAAIIEISLFTFLGKLVDLMKEAKSPQTFIEDHWVSLSWMAFVAIIARPVVFALHAMIGKQIITPNFTTLIRWQTHRYVLRQSLTFFQNDFAGRVATKVLQSGPALRETVLQLVDALWFVTMYSVGALIIFFQTDPVLMIPLVIWMFIYAGILWYFVPRIQKNSIQLSEANSLLTGRIVDSYTNILTVKLFADAAREDSYARDAMEELRQKFHGLLRQITLMEVSIWFANGFLIAGTAGLAIWFWSLNLMTLGAITVATGLIIRINNMSAWIMWVITGVFENIGRVQESMQTIAKPLEVTDIKAAGAIDVPKGQIQFDHIKFNYGQSKGIIDDLSLTIRPGEKVGLVGRSGAGKSTLVNLLLRFYDLEGGRILIDGQDISQISQESLRAKIGMVTQDTSLLHRSVKDNILYGLPDADTESVMSAARRAQAHEFIQKLEDKDGRQAYEALVGERGVKLSGGQRQRIAIARVLLKDAPILILDEATSALDSEVEAAIQDQFHNLMRGKTVIAIAHRLSTIAAMDRLIIMDQGRIVEEGSHEELIRQNGLYAQLWARQSGGFLVEEAAAETTMA